MNLMDLFVKVGVDDQASGKLASLTHSIGNGLKNAAAVGVKAVTAASAAVSGLVAASVKSFADYEQLVGGVDTLFKGSSQKLQAYAAEAYKTANLSANQYMETVTSFSASLISSLGGDTEAAVQYADMAITDMADNANKMGTGIEMIQNAYANFAKGQFDLLDNLRLGYGGSQEEMTRLLRDAEKLEGLAAGTFDLENFADIAEAIHIIQEEMGIAGATAAEAAGTISGSVATMKAAWLNLVTGIANKDADLKGLIGNFVESVKVVGQNVGPVVEQSLQGVVQLIQSLGPEIAQALPALITQVLPGLAQGAVSIVQALVQALKENAGILADSAVDIIMTLSSGLLESLPELAAAGMEILVKLAQSITESLPELVPAITATITEISRLLTDPDTLAVLITAALAIVVALGQGIIDALPELYKQIVALINAAADWLIFEGVPKLFQAGADLLDGIVSGIGSVINRMAEAGEEVVTEIYNGIVNDFERLKNAGKEIIGGIKQGISDAWNDLTTWFNGIWDSLFGNRTVDVEVNTSENKRASGSFAGGLSYVPYDNFLANLHKGERILTAEENDDYNGGVRGGVVVNQYISAKPTTPVELAAATQAYFQQARWAF